MFKWLFWFLLPITALWMAEGGEPGGGGDPPPASDPTSGIQGLIAKHKNDLMAVITELFTDNYKYRDKNRELRQQLKEAEAKAPKEGSVVLSSERAALLEQYEALGKPDELKQAKVDLETAQTEVKTLKWESVLDKAASTHKFKPGVFKHLAGELTLEMREVEREGKKEPAAFVVNGDGQAVALEEYATKNWAEFLPALRIEATQPGGTTFIAQNPGGEPPKGNMVSDFISEAQKARDGKPNPLKRGSNQ